MEIGEILKSLDAKQLELWIDDGGEVPEDALMKAVEAISERKVEKGKPANSIPVEERKQLADVVRILLRKEVNVDSKTEMGNTVLIQAARRGQMETVQLLVEKGATVSEEGSRGWTALGTAAWFGYTSIVDYLMKHGAKTDESTIDGNTVLHLAVNEGKTETAKFLVENGANLFGQNKQKRTEVHRTIEEGHTELFEWLKSRGALKDKDDKGRNKLHLAVQSAPQRNLSSWDPIWMLKMTKEEQLFILQQKGDTQKHSRNLLILVQMLMRRTKMGKLQCIYQRKLGTQI